MSDIEFIKGMIAGIKISKSIVENSSTDTEIVAAMNGAIFTMEFYIKQEEENHVKSQQL